jgi:hypothetical protein
LHQNSSKRPTAVLLSGCLAAGHLQARTERAKAFLHCKTLKLDPFLGLHFGNVLYHFVEPWHPSFHEIAEFLTGHQAEVADDRVLATVLFTDIVDSTRRASHGRP